MQTFKELTDIRRNRGAARLAMAIIQKAADDYRDLELRGVESRKTRYEGTYSKEEIRDFFNGKYCEWMLKHLYLSEHAVNLFRILENEKRNRKLKTLKNLKP